ncbi:YhhA family cyclophane-containing RiPP [Merismopedia glauca]|uniref:Uncharacterized protein n=1 Tax=Merismopedia glauca CCAP 1448/3 TaxID=1296344 RepID=A0A2T1C260_9CYAN|nr:YhhA family cyclophane-containing RiPP [Merismopedia glauca]PSB02360.1 hypothetical protein C7B64_13560 [Merismopedia glauca CCAP 1448/3]
MVQNASLDRDVSADQTTATKEKLIRLLVNTKLNHPALNRIQMQLDALPESGIEARITSYDRMHHRHNRS